MATIPVQLALGLRSLVPVNNDADAQRRFAYALRAAMAAKGFTAQTGFEMWAQALLLK